MKWTQAASREVSDAMIAALPAGYSGAYRGGTIMEGGSLIMKIEVTPPGAVSGEAAAFAMWADMYGLKADALGASFDHGGRSYKVTGLKPRTKRPLLAERDDGKEYAFPMSMIDQIAPDLLSGERATIR